MYFILSKISGIILAPLNLAFLLIFCGFFVCLRWRRAGLWLQGAGLAVLVAGGILPLGHNALTGLESRYDAPAAMPDDVDGILILGGSVDTEIGAERQTFILNDAAERLVAGVMLARHYPRAQIVFSGGNSSLRGTGETEAQNVARFLRAAGLAEGRAVFEDRSRNTVENIAFSKVLAGPRAGQRWILVTSAWHMKRAMAVMHRAEWPGEIVPWPTDYRTDGKKRLWPGRFDVKDNMDKAGLALHETIGSLTYRQINMGAGQ